MNIDWENLRRHLHQLRESVDGAQASPEQLQQQLAERARAMANTSAHTAQRGAEALQVLEVDLAGVHYAFELKYLVGVLPWTALTPVPGAPSFVLGMLLDRGRVVSCVDLLSFLGLPVAQLTDPVGIVVLADGDMEIGVPVQQVVGVEKIVVAAPTGPSQLSGRGQSMLLGVTPGGAFVLDGARLLSDSRLPVSG